MREAGGYRELSPVAREERNKEIEAGEGERFVLICFNLQYTLFLCERAQILCEKAKGGNKRGK